MSTAVGFGDEPEYDALEREPDDHEDELIGAVTHVCGCSRSYYNGYPEDLPAAASLCYGCEPCPCCGEKYSDCTCPKADPFWARCKRCNGPHDDEMLEYCADCRTLEPGY